MTIDCKHGTAWVKIGLAVSLAQALQMTDEPSMSLSPSAREERRRTLWSIYLLDKMATCGRRRPALFLDRNCTLHLPSSDFAFQSSSEELVPTLGNFKNSENWTCYSISAPAKSVVIASVLSQIAGYMIQRSDRTDEKLPWDHTSEYQVIRTHLSRLETMFEGFQPLQTPLGHSSLPSSDYGVGMSDAVLFSYVLYQLCYCLLHHPFLLHRKTEGGPGRVPFTFRSQSLESARVHAQELINAILRGKHSGLTAAASFYGYCVLVAGTIHALFQHSPDEAIKNTSTQTLQFAEALLEDKSRVWWNSSLMVRISLTPSVLMLKLAARNLH
jgi:hypothetical protein